MSLISSIPLVGPLLLSNKLLKMFSPAAQEELITKYMSAVGFGPDAQFGEEAFETFATQKINNLEGFKDTKDADDQPALKRVFNVKNNEAAERIKTKVSEALVLDPAFETAKDTYLKDLAALKELTQIRPPKYKPQALIERFKEIHDAGLEAIQAQQLSEKDKFTTYLNSAEFEADLTGVLPAGTDFQTIKDNMLHDFEAAQKKQEDDFKASYTTVANKLHDSNELERKKFLFIGTLFDNNIMRQRIQELASERNPIGPNTGVVVGITEQQISFAGISPADLGTITTFTGKKLETTDGGQSYTLKTGSSLTDFFYYQSTRQKVLADLTLMAHAIAANGYDRMTFDVNIQPQEAAMERARLAYEAAIDAGFTKPKVPKPENDKSPDHIVINVNGTKMKIDELFKGHENRLHTIDQKAATIQNERKQLNKVETGSADFVALKQDFQDFKAQALAAAAAAPPAANAPPPIAVP